MMKTIPEFIEALGGNAEISRRLGKRNTSTVSEMKRRGSIPNQYWPAFIELAAENKLEGVDAQYLLKLHIGELPEAA